MSKKLLIAVAVVVMLLAGLAAALLYAYSPGLSFARAHTGLGLSSAKVIERREPTFFATVLVLEVSEGEAMLLNDLALEPPANGIPFVHPPPELTSDARYLAGCRGDTAWVGALDASTRRLLIEIVHSADDSPPPCPPGVTDDR